MGYGWYDNTTVPFDTLVGKTLVKVEESNDSVSFYTSEGEHYELYHRQDCCESVWLDSVDGDLQGLVGSPIVSAVETTESGSGDSDSHTWSFYRIRTNREFVHLTFRGESNGYYSETLDLILHKERHSYNPVGTYDREEDIYE